MPELRFEDHVYQVDDFDTVLNTLLKNGHAIPNFCRGGICHSCMMKAEEGTPLPFTQIGLSDELVAENYFLTCQCAVYAPMTIRRPDKDKRTRFVAMVREKEQLSERVVRLVLSPAHEFVYQAGQYTTLINVDGLAGDFPIASVRGEEGGLMEFHIPDIADSPLHQYLFSQLGVDDGLEIQTALGDCYYSEALGEKNLLIVAVDAALASGLSVLGKAAQEQHAGSLKLQYFQHSVDDAYFGSAVAQAGLPDSVERESTLAESEQVLLQKVTAVVEGVDSDTQILVAAEPVFAQQIMAILPDRCRSISVSME